MNNMDVKMQIVELIRKVTNITIQEDNYDTHFFSSKINLTPRDLVYIFMEVEESFSVNIPEENIINEEFTTINKISQIICSFALS